MWPSRVRSGGNVGKEMKPEKEQEPDQVGPWEDVGGGSP